jgi:hypothetical protein
MNLAIPPPAPAYFVHPGGTSAAGACGIILLSGGPMRVEQVGPDHLIVTVEVVGDPPRAVPLEAVNAAARNVLHPLVATLGILVGLAGLMEARGSPALFVAVLAVSAVSMARFASSGAPPPLRSLRVEILGARIEVDGEEVDSLDVTPHRLCVDGRRIPLGTRQALRQIEPLRAAIAQSAALRAMRHASPAAIPPALAAIRRGRARQAEQTE